ncbi:TIGR03086 family metal-binding protein [Streptomyces scopuliridis]|uniref:TIGR03086 family metal-binding protein n=1 Tax=Streptomyces scopuliridis TaxID=452529 RepID=UPI0036884FC3
MKSGVRRRRHPDRRREVPYEMGLIAVAELGGQLRPLHLRARAGPVDHLFQVVVNFQALAAKKDSDFGAAPEHLTGAWRDRFADETVRLIAAWDAPGAEEGTSGAMGMPARTVGAMVVGDLAVHGWDLARATAQPYEPDAALVGMLGAEFGALAPTARKMGVFGEPVPVGEDAGPFEALLAMTGRDPGWSRP